MDDIEELAGTTVLPPARPPTRRILPRKFNSSIKFEKPVAQSLIPGSQSVFVKTWGCSHNSSDSEYMAGLLSTYGYRITDDAMSADCWLLNSCTVKTPSEDGLRNSIMSATKLGKKVVVAGCVSQGAPDTKFIEGYSVVGTHQIDRVVEVVEETMKGHSVRLFGQKREGTKKLGGASLHLPKIRKNPLIEIIAINTGCLNQCTYCKTKHARGELGSYPIEEIVQRGQQCFEEGVREVWMTSEDTGAYGRDIGVTLPELLYEFVKIIPEGCMLRLGMTNPPYILDYLEDMVTILSHPRVYAFLHVPVQAASDNVLEDMKREYTCGEFRKVVDYLREHVPGVTIATDIICGFPTESEEDFNETLALIDQYQFPSLFINQFFPRPGTPAARMKRIPADQVKLRTKRATEIFQKQFPYKGKVGSVETVLVTELATDGEHYVGHNKFYEQVLVPKDESYMGTTLTVKITETGKHYMKCEVLEVGSTMKLPSTYSNPNRIAFSEGPKKLVQNLLPSSPHTTRNFLLLLFAGLFVQLVYIVLRSRWNKETT